MPEIRDRLSFNAAHVTPHPVFGRSHPADDAHPHGHVRTCRGMAAVILYRFQDQLFLVLQRLRNGLRIIFRRLLGRGGGDFLRIGFRRVQVFIFLGRVQAQKIDC